MVEDAQNLCLGNIIIVIGLRDGRMAVPLLDIEEEYGKLYYIEKN